MLKTLTYIILFVFFTSSPCLLGQENVVSLLKESNEKITQLQIENAALKVKLETYISESDKKIGILTWPLGAIITLLVLIYGLGAFRSTQLAKQEARKAFKEDFEKIKSEVEQLRKQAEKELEEIGTLKDAAKASLNG